MHKVALDTRHVRAQPQLHQQRQRHSKQHCCNRETRRPLLNRANQRHHDGKIDENAVLLQVADAYAQRHEEQAAYAEVEPAAVQVELADSDALGLRLLERGDGFGGAEADDGGSGLELGQRPRGVLALGRRRGFWFAAALPLGDGRDR